MKTDGIVREGSLISWTADSDYRVFGIVCRFQSQPEVHCAIFWQDNGLSSSFPLKELERELEREVRTATTTWRLEVY